MNDKLANDMLWVNSVDDPVYCRKCGEAMRKPEKPNGMLMDGTYERGAWADARCDDCGISQAWTYERTPPVPQHCP